jgi:ATP-dependent Lon protease
LTTECQTILMEIKIKKIVSDQLDNDMEFMPIVPMGELELNDEEKKAIPNELPVIALRNTTLFPNVIIPITVARDKSVQALEYAKKNGNFLAVVAQKDTHVEDPDVEDIYKVGVVAKIIRNINLPDGNTTILIMGRARMEIEEITQNDPFFKATVKILEDIVPNNDEEFKAMISSIKDMSERIISLSPNMPLEMSVMLKNIENHSFLIHYVATNLSISIEEKQQLLMQQDVKQRVADILRFLNKEVQFAELKSEITNKTKDELDKQQREYFLQQQLKSITEELGSDGTDKEVKTLEERAQQKLWSDDVKSAFFKGIEKLRRTHPHAPDYNVTYNHLELLLDLPWNEYTTDTYDLKKALQILNEDHFGMEKIKDRILEYLAVLQLKGDMKSPILCFVGPPGVGKTSLAHSIARAINRKYARLSLGGLHDESELRGHRKTYIGAMPGRIIQSLKKVKTANPVIILDEIEKMGKDFRGDPSSALLEILDPEQNIKFYDNYVEQEFDLSKVLFIATANSINEIQPALRDRLEIIQLSGYSTEEKIEIAKKHLVPKQKKAHGLEDYSFKMTPNAIKKVIIDYTRESGVRNLDRQLASIFRYLAKEIVLDHVVYENIDEEVIEQALGKPIFSNEIYTKEKPAGVAVGLAWTSVGGEILFIESLLSVGKGQMTLTGNLGNVMKESASTAFTYIKAHASDLNLDEEMFDKKNIHIHVPEGAVPKDGPSAGITMVSAMASAFTGRKIKPFLAMSGEITLRGDVLPVGGIKEKLLAAKRAGMKEIILCYLNEKDVDEIPKNYIKGMKVHYVRTIDEVLEIALTKK